MTYDVYERERRDPSPLLPPSERSLVLPRDRLAAQSRFIDPVAARTAKGKAGLDPNKKQGPVPPLLHPLFFGRRQTLNVISVDRKGRQRRRVCVG